MGQRLMALATCIATMTTPAWAADRKAEPPTSSVVFDAFKAYTDQTIEAFLTGLRPAALDAAARAQVMASLPEKGDLRPSRTEAEKIAAAQRVLDYSARGEAITVKVIDLDFAFMGLYYRTVLLVSRRELGVIDTDEFVALAAHEVGHDYDWNDYFAAMTRHDHARMRQLELRSDGLAVLTLRRLGLDPERLVSAVQKVTRYNERLDATANAEDYVSLAERVAFIRAVAALEWAQAPAQTARARPPQ